MMSFGEGFGAVEANVGGGGTKFPELKGYTFVITQVVNAPSKAGDPMMWFGADIAEGEFTGFFSEHNKRLYQLYGKVPVGATATAKEIEDNTNRQGRMKGLIETIIAENAAMFPEAQIDWNTFEEARLIGCTVGGVLKQDGKYTELSYFCSKAKAAEAPVVEMVDEPVVAAKGSAGSDGGLF